MLSLQNTEDISSTKEIDVISDFRSNNTFVPCSWDYVIAMKRHEKSEVTPLEPNSINSTFIEELFFHKKAGSFE